MSTERGHGNFLNGLFSTQMTKLCFYKAVPFPKIFQWLTYLTQKNIESSFHGSTRPSRPGPFHFLVHQLHKIHEGGTCYRGILHPVSSALKALLPFVVMAHSLTSFRSLCKCLPFRDACPSQLSFYPFIFLYAIYHNLRICLLYDSLY